MIMEETQIEISNLDTIKLYLRDELKIATDKLSKSIKATEPLEKVEISNLKSILDSLKKLEDAITGMDMKPVISVQSPDVRIPDITIPEIIVPTPQAFVTVEPANITVQPTPVNIDLFEIINALEPLRLLSHDPDSPISVRMSDGVNFLEQLKVISDQFVDSNKQMAVTYAGSTGISKDEFKAGTKEIYRSNTATNTKVSIGVASTAVLSASANRISATLVNDSDTVIYVSKSSTAVLNEGIRLNANGGALIVDDYTGAISAISSGAAKNLTVCEVS